MGRGRGASSSKGKKKGLSCPDGACYLDSDSSDSCCSDSDCSDCLECAPRRRSSTSKSKSKSKSKTKSKTGKSTAAGKKKKKTNKKKSTRDSSSCSCSDCMDYSSDDSYNCPPARGRKCSTC